MSTAPDRSARSRLERASLPVMVRLSKVPRPVLFLVVLALMVGGALVPGWGWVLLGVVALFLAWVLLLAWPRLTSSERLMRASVVVLVVALAIIRANPRG